MYVMQHQGFFARIMKARKLFGSGPHSLPPGNPVDVYPVDAFKEPLSSWISGPGNYVVPVDPDWGLWFDWTKNDWTNTAVLLSIKGMNPITGQRTNGFALERYIERCPIHDKPFKDGLFCEECNFKWPDQNYVTYPNKLWWDGFRTSDGKVRQFFFTEDLAKSIPELVIGKEDTVPAFGFAFFKPKKPRESIIQTHMNETFKQPIFMSNVSKNYVVLDSMSKSFDTLYESSCSESADMSCDEPKPMTLSAGTLKKSTTKSSSNLRGLLRSCNVSNTIGQPLKKSVSAYYSAPVAGGASCDCESSVNFSDSELVQPEQKRLTTEVGVGAGAEIIQNLTVDPLNVSDWNDKPDSVMRLFFVFVDQFNMIKEKGMKDLTGEKEGFLSGLPVG